MIFSWQRRTGSTEAPEQPSQRRGQSADAVNELKFTLHQRLIEELDPRARLNSGTLSPYAMVQGVDSGVQAALFVGYHARAGSQNGILDHTWSSSLVANVWLNERAVGEIGLDFHYDFSPRDEQRRVFSEQLALAVRLGVTAVIHTREAFDDTMTLLADSGIDGSRIVFHSFTGGPEETRRALDLGEPRHVRPRIRAGSPQ